MIKYYKKGDIFIKIELDTRKMLTIYLNQIIISIADASFEEQTDLKKVNKKLFYKEFQKRFRDFKSFI